MTIRPTARRKLVLLGALCAGLSAAEERDVVACGDTLSGSISRDTSNSVDVTGEAKPDAVYEISVAQETRLAIGVCTSDFAHDVSLFNYDSGGFGDAALSTQRGSISATCDASNTGGNAVLQVTVASGTYAVVVEPAVATEGGSFLIDVVCDAADAPVGPPEESPAEDPPAAEPQEDGIASTSFGMGTVTLGVVLAMVVVGLFVLPAYVYYFHMKKNNASREPPSIVATEAPNAIFVQQMEVDETGRPSTGSGGRSSGSPRRFSFFASRRHSAPSPRLSLDSMSGTPTVFVSYAPIRALRLPSAEAFDMPQILDSEDPAKMDPELGLRPSDVTIDDYQPSSPGRLGSQRPRLSRTTIQDPAAIVWTVAQTPEEIDAQRQRVRLSLEAAHSEAVRQAAQATANADAVGERASAAADDAVGSSAAAEGEAGDTLQQENDESSDED